MGGVAPYFISHYDDFCRKCLHHPESSRTPKFPFSFSLFRRFPRTHTHTTNPSPPPHATKQSMLSTRLAAAARLRPAFARLSSSSASSSKAAVPAEAQPVPAVVPQSPNHAATWSTNQRPRPAGQSGPRFEQTTMELQPNPLSAMELIANEPIRVIQGRKAICDGGKSTKCEPPPPARKSLDY
jgi:NADH dehydrogenase (ubiquinone) Fe-S protein 6